MLEPVSRPLSNSSQSGPSATGKKTLKQGNQIVKKKIMTRQRSKMRICKYAQSSNQQKQTHRRRDGEITESEAKETLTMRGGLLPMRNRLGSI